MDLQTILNSASTSTSNSSSVPPLSFYHLLSGSFSSLSIFLLAFSPIHRTLHLVLRIPGLGPHQYIATNHRRDRVYATSWAQPPALSSWAVEKPEDGIGYHDNQWRVRHVNTVLITATSSYITLPPPYTHLYSAGGPTGEVHLVDATTGGFAEKVQELLFVPEDELEGADKTRVALRYGSHAVEISSRGQAFIPVLGTNSIHMYATSRQSGHLTLLSTTISPRPGDGPRHVVVSPDGSVLYSVTEHTNYLDVYAITPTSLTHIHSASLLPPGMSVHLYRGDTLRLRPPSEHHPAPTHLFVTTRGGSSGTRGFVVVFELDEKGFLTTRDAGDSGVGAKDVSNFVQVERWETPTSGGKANAIELKAKSAGEGDGVWIVLTDDEPRGAGVRVLEWGAGEGITVVAGWPKEGDESEVMGGGSHAVWLD